MYTLIRTLTFKTWLTQQLPTLLGALLLSEFFFKFHSFMLETSAFLVTWYALDRLWQSVLRKREPRLAAAHE